MVPGLWLGHPLATKFLSAPSSAHVDIETRLYPGMSEETANKFYQALKFKCPSTSADHTPAARSGMRCKSETIDIELIINIVTLHFQENSSLFLLYT